MDQKNTIVKCAKHKCLFNNCGTCEQYVITIGVDNTCQAYTETEGFTFKEQKTCHDDCIHFDDSDPFVGPICLFKHPEPLKEFYDGMPCDYYHKRGHRAKCNVYDDMMDIDDKHLGETVAVKMKVAELNKPNTNKSIISDWNYAATPDICKTCKKVVYGQSCKWKDVAYGVWTCYEEEK